MGSVTKRIYDPVDAGDGARFLVDRLWPRGISKEKAALAGWLKALSPSDLLRKQYHGATAESAEAWQDFVAAYALELDASDGDAAADLATLRDALAAGPVTLLYAAKDPDHNNAVALKIWLERG